MNVVSINGSPKGESSNTSVMLDSLTSAFDERDVVRLVLGNMRINYCRGCYSCWTKTPGVCVQDDDMGSAIKTVRKADLLILGSPLYFNNISGTLKTFIDRLTALGGNPHQPKGADAGKVRIIMASNCGFPVRQQFDVVSLWMKHFAHLLNGELVGEFYATNGKVLRSANGEEAAAVERYKEYLRTCGRCIKENGKLSKELEVQLGKSILEF
jgi:multimeric flavodoxin WrbA